ncbi:MAG: lysophospholipid acyltransferase family protein [Saprospiraceae bacterium]|nr:lysophospholipid acyltransferase family protein [Saprospiraceae bacterium]
MAALIYWISLPFIYLISWLPFSILYLLSDLLYFILYKIFKYRIGVVQRNLKNAFPEKSEAEIALIRDRFYHYFCDLILETIKTLTISPATVRSRITFDSMLAFKRFYQEHQSVIIVMGHFGNWEMAGAGFSQLPLHTLYVIYHPMKNKYFDRLIYHMRTRLGNKLYAMKETFRGMIADRNKLTATAFIADQTPSPDHAYWTTFLNQDTPVFTGTAKISSKLNYPIIYISMQRPKRGYYHIESELLIEDPKSLTEDEISELHTRRLEKDIIARPELWLWTHRRWKHERKESMS